MDSHTIDQYIELEKEIASHEAKSPALILQQKSNQMLHLEERIKQQEENVEALDEQTWVLLSQSNSLDQLLQCRSWSNISYWGNTSRKDQTQEGPYLRLDIIDPQSSFCFHSRRFNSICKILKGSIFKFLKGWTKYPIFTFTSISILRSGKVGWKCVRRLL